jgi:hypothetical protein
MEAELQSYLGGYGDHQLADGRWAVVRNGYQLEHTLTTGIGEVAVRRPKTRDRSGAGVHFTSRVLPPYLRKACSVEELLPWLWS